MKLVSGTGIGVIAAGVAKAGANVITISGHNGGTGSSPLTSIKNTGLPWEIGLRETHETLLRAGLRSRVALRVDGGMRFCPRHPDRRDSRRRRIRLRHRRAPRHRLRHGASMPLEYLPRRHRHARRKAAPALQRQARNGHRLFPLTCRRGSQWHGRSRRAPPHRTARLVRPPRNAFGPRRLAGHSCFQAAQRHAAADPRSRIAAASKSRSCFHQTAATANGRHVIHNYHRSVGSAAQRRSHAPSPSAMAIAGSQHSRISRLGGPEFRRISRSEGST